MGTTNEDINVLYVCGVYSRPGEIDTATDTEQSPDIHIASCVEIPYRDAVTLSTLKEKIKDLERTGESELECFEKVYHHILDITNAKAPEREITMDFEGQYKQGDISPYFRCKG